MSYPPNTRPDRAPANALDNATESVAAPRAAEPEQPLPGLPTARAADRLFDPPAALAPLREEAPLRRMAYPDGHVGWLATGYAAVRAIVADRRFSSRYELKHYPFTGLPSPAELPPAPPGELTGMDPPEHTRYRKLVAGRFTARRMRQLTTRVEAITAEQLDEMARQGPPADLVAAYARPVPTLMICELLGVPYEQRSRFQRDAEIITGEAPSEQTLPAWEALSAFLHELVRAKRARPTDDLLSDLTDSDLSDDELTTLGVVLLGAGLDTTANMISLGTFALLQHPDQLAALRADPGIIDQAVDELLRYLSIAHTDVRAALEDVEIDGRLVKAGESVTISAQAANRDPRQFPDPDTLDLHRAAASHLAFGHGTHLCLGQHLARVEMRTAFPALLTRFPTLRLAVPPEEVPLRMDASIHGAYRLPVTWETG